MRPRTLPLTLIAVVTMLYSATPVSAAGPDADRGADPAPATARDTTPDRVGDQRPDAHPCRRVGATTWAQCCRRLDVSAARCCALLHRHSDRVSDRVLDRCCRVTDRVTDRVLDRCCRVRDRVSDRVLDRCCRVTDRVTDRAADRCCRVLDLSPQRCRVWIARATDAA